MTTALAAGLLPAAKDWELELRERLPGSVSMLCLNTSAPVEIAKARFRLFVGGAEPGAPDPGERPALRDLELAFRALVKQRFQEVYGNSWLEELHAKMSADAVSDALATMKQRKAYSTSDFLHFTQLKDVRELISSEWQSLFHAAFCISKKKFNSLADVVVKARTEHAHHRPERLFSRVETQRAEVAAHDLLNALLSREKLVREASRAYFPYIRAARFLYLDQVKGIPHGQDGKTLREIMERLFATFEVGIENAVEIETFERLLEAAGFQLEIGTEASHFDTGRNWQRLLYSAAVRVNELPEDERAQFAHSNYFVMTRDRRFIVSPAALSGLDTIYARFREYALVGPGPSVYEGPRRR